ncbi:(4Fe-4S)-binding protein [Nocardioides sp. NPDC127514]|uniref:(4Fe-4S)-binding protein n=1 Tax=unclassified Nocardioides TaxID=2615069 RepID=UPI003330AF84
MAIDDDATSTANNAIREYAGLGVVVTWEQGRCEHATECVRGLPLVFKPKQRPWIEAFNATADELVVTIDRCPSYALGYRTSDGRTREVPTLGDESSSSQQRA